MLEIGRPVKVKVLDIDRDRQRISLGLKQTQSDPWQQVIDHYREGDVVQGRVTKVVTFGAFVEILPGVEGLVHISELAQHHVENPREIVQQGEVVQVKLIEMDADRRRLSLSLKRVEPGDEVQPAIGGTVYESLVVEEPEPEAEPAADEPAAEELALEAEAVPEELALEAGPEEPMLEAGPEASRWRPRRRSSRSGPRRRSRCSRRAPRSRSPRLARPRRPRSRSSRSRPPRPRRTTSGSLPGAAAAPARARRPVAVAVTGGIGAGKSEFLRAFARHGAAVTSSDEIVHRLLAEDATVRRAVIERFGERVLDPDERIDRAALGRIVFAEPGELEWLEALLHPLVVEAQRRWRDERGPPGPARRVRDRGAAPLRDRRRDPLRRGGLCDRVSRGPGRAHRRARRGAARAAAPSRRGEAPSWRFRLRQRRHARGARRVRRLRARHPRGQGRVMTRPTR